MARIIDGSLGVSARRGVVALAAGLVLAVALGSPTAGLAAGVNAPEAGGVLDLQTWVESGQLVIVTAIAVPESTKLPATVRIPVPDGAAVQWAGEILGGDLSADPARPYKIVKSPAGGQYAEFTLEQTRSAQVDSQSSTVTVDGAKTSAAFEWVQSNASGVKITPEPSGAPDTNSNGERLYSGGQMTLTPGQTQNVAFSYSTVVAGPSTASTDPVRSLVIVLIIALVAAVAALAVAVARQRKGAVPAQPGPATSQGPSAKVQTAADKPASGTTADEDWGFDDAD
jgi:hypothetical protein